MKRIALLAPSVLLILMTAAFSSSAVYAQGGPPPIQGYHIENQMLHCINKFVPCNTPATAANSLYTNVEADRLAKGKTHGTPDAVNMVCGYAYLDQNNLIHFVSERVSAGFEKGTIKGTASLEGDYSLKSTHATAEIDHIVAYDAMTRDTAWVNGEIVVNNKTNLRVSGGFYLKLKGPIYDEYTDAAGKSHVTNLGYAEVSCNSAASYVKAPFATGPYFIASLGAPPGP